jgi:lipooligosaccharide transport system ATP-binding protein
MLAYFVYHIVALRVPQLTVQHSLNRLFGFDLVRDRAEIRTRMELIGHKTRLYEDLTGRENLVLVGRLYHMDVREVRRRAVDLLERFELTEAADRPARTYSGGMKRRLDLAISMIEPPRLLFLDEPTTGLDPQARHLLWDRLYRLKQRGVTLVLTTHYMDEAEQLCDRLVVMDKAAIVAAGTPRELIEGYSTKEVLELRFPPDVQETLEGELDGIVDGTNVRRLERLPDRVVPHRGLGEPVAVLLRHGGQEVPDRDVGLARPGRDLPREHVVGEAEDGLGLEEAGERSLGRDALGELAASSASASVRRPVAMNARPRE